ncbi:MAG: hypothetical protein JWN82_614 [Candidatus Saccharibacteria bacterium]|nr:hypothetical protein [Candidatus Saccharibacteria bacterium]
MYSLTPVEARAHPVVNFLDNEADYLAGFNNDFNRLNYPSSEAWNYVKEGLAPLAEGIVEIEEFGLDKPDLLALWPFVINHLKHRAPRYRFAEIMTGAYAVQGASNPEWKRLPESFLQTRELPPVASKDATQLTVVNKRFYGVVRNYQAIRDAPGPKSDAMYELGENFANGLQTLRGRLYRQTGVELLDN